MRPAARLIQQRVTGRPALGPFRYLDLGTMATISAGDAVADAFGLRLSGLPGKAAWAFVHLAFLAGWGNRLGVLARWAYEAGTGNRSERVILEGVGTGSLDELGRSDEPAPFRQDRAGMDDVGHQAQATPEQACSDAAEMGQALVVA